MGKLTAKQEKFAQLIALENKSQAEAYRDCYSVRNASDKTVWEMASTLAANPKVATRINELRKEAMTPLVMSAQRRREKLTELAGSDDPNVAMKAIDLLNKMDGEYVHKVQAEVDSQVVINVELVDDG